MKENIKFISLAALLIGIINKNQIYSKAECGSDVPLCRDKPQILDTNICMDQEIKWSMPSCCSGDSIEANSCQKNPEPTCRVVELSTPFSASTDECCAELELTFEWSKNAASCCRACSCFGDPHCISFEGKVDTWIICDGRTKNEGAVYGKELICPIKKGACEGQLDHLGNQCTFKNLGPVSEFGSPCQTSSPEKASIIMHKSKNFELSLFLGERGIIESIRIKNGENFYHVNAQACTTMIMPWRDSPDATKPPNDPKWLPNLWRVANTNGGKVWYISGLDSGMEIEMRCVYNSFGSLPRINIDSLADPLNKRPDESGVCVTGEIDKKLSTHQRTNQIQKFCRSLQSQGEAIEYFCGLDYLTMPAKCMKILCAELVSDTLGRENCVGEIVKYQNDEQFKDGWERVWCAYNTLASRDPSKCTTSNSCLQCMYDIYDFTWSEAVKRWKDYNDGAEAAGISGPCIPLNAINASLSECENGITFQYLDTSAINENGEETECWVDFASIPEGRNICGGNILTLSSLAGANTKEINFFNKKIRIKQCNNQALCKNSQPKECSPEYGISGTISLTPDPVSNRANLYWQLVREGKLVCTSSQPNCLAAAYGSQFLEAKCTGCDFCKAK